MIRAIVASLLLVLPAAALPAKPFEIVIQRNISCNKGEAAGSLSVDGQEVVRTLELPWKNNEENISRVPAGKYKARIRADGALGWRIELDNVPDRKNVQLHVGNYPRDSTGCVLIGTKVSAANNTCSIEGSKTGLDALKTAMDKASSTGVSSQPLEISVTIKD